MSRAWAGFGGLVGGLTGFVVGSAAGVQLRGRIPEGEASERGAILGTMIGTFAGAALGAGSCAPKIVGTAGVGALPHVDERRFP